MRGVSGLDRPAVQWLFVGAALVLIVAAVSEAIAIRRGRATADALRADVLNARLEREEMEVRLTREQSAREALALEVARLRGPRADDLPPTLTLTPLGTRRATPPLPSVAPPSPSQVIALRLVLPPAADTRRPYSIVLRDWSGGATIWSRGQLAATRAGGQAMVIAHLAGDVLARGAYELVLTVTDVSGQTAEVATYELAIG